MMGAVDVQSTGLRSTGSPSRDGAERRKVLIAEDNYAIAEVVRFNLDRAGIDVTVARNGREAWEHAQSGGFELVVTDFQMPEMNGDELCQRLRGTDTYRTTPIVLLSGKGLELDRDLLERVQFHEVVFKPFSPRCLVATVVKALEETVAAE